jgi:signal transduction histidine kinase
MGGGIAPAGGARKRARCGSRENGGSGWRYAAIDAARVIAVAGLQVLGTWAAAHHQPSARPLGIVGTTLLLLGPVTLPLGRRAPWLTLGVTLVVALTYISIGYPRGPVFASVVVALADIFRERRAQARTARRQEDNRRQDNERLRLARELHDVLAHSAAVVSVQAGVALHLIDTHPEQVRRSLEAIREASADSLRELRAAVDLLRTDSSSRTAALPAGPGLAGLEMLVGSAGSAGVTVRSTIEGMPRQLRPELDLAAYRIIQESLTNAARHAGPGDVDLYVRYSDDVVELRIDSQGRAEAKPRAATATTATPITSTAGAATPTAATAATATAATPTAARATAGATNASEREGRGLTGMRERAAALGGSVHAAPTADGGFRVLAQLPYGSGR